MHPEAMPLRIYRAELHIHTVLSPCAAVEMIPPLIIEEAQSKGIDILAITDHNATANIQAVMQAAEGSGVTVLPGMELHTREEVHIVCLFPGLPEAEAFQREVEMHLPTGKNRPDVWGPQYVVDSSGGFLRHEEHILGMATSLTINEGAAMVHSLGGLFIPAHIQRSMYGIIPTLGFLPADVLFDAVELPVRSNTLKPAHASQTAWGYPTLFNGDAHHLEDICGANQFLLAQPTFAEIGLALRQQEGRRLLALHE